VSYVAGEIAIGCWMKKVLERDSLNGTHMAQDSLAATNHSEREKMGKT
jgi:hypothetical protein